MKNAPSLFSALSPQSCSLSNFRFRWLLVAALTLSGLHALAQEPGQPAIPPAAPGALPDGWPAMVGAFLLAVSTAYQGWLNSSTAAERRRADAAEEQVREMVEKLEKLSEELRATQKERDQWMRRAYSQGWKSSDSIPIRKDRDIP